MAVVPTGQTTTYSGLAHYPTVYYSTQALDVLRQMYHFRGATQEETMPMNKGKTIQWYRPTVMTANITPTSESTIGSSLNLSTTTVTATVQEFSDFISGSTLLVETDITPTETMHAKELGSRAGLTVDTLARLEFDSNSGAFVNSSTTNPGTIGATASLADAKARIADLKANLVRPLKGDAFMVITHPYVTYDIKADNTAGGFLDIGRYGDTKALVDNEVGRMAQGVFVESTNVGTSGTSPSVLYRMYVVGQGALGSVSLAGRGPSMVSDPYKQNFKVSVLRGGNPTLFDPEGKIGFVASYRFVNVFKTLDSTTYRYRVIPCNASLV